MKKQTGFILFILVYLLCPVRVIAQFQPAEVIRSQEKTIINGKIFYIHTVQKGQTLYSICKAYGVNQEVVLRENPGTDPAALNEGQVIRIPEQGSREAAVYPVNREDFYAHVIKRGQTVYALSRRYNVTEELIFHYNPWAREGIKDGQTVWIPRNKVMPELTDETVNNDLFFYYTVKPHDTLSYIARSYGIRPSDIINANPELREGLKSGQVLKIPRIKTPEPDQTAVTDTLDESLSPCIPAGESVVYEIALLLPFFAEFNMEETLLPVDTLVEEGTYVPVQRQQGLRGRNFAEFYEGFMLALDSLRKTGFSANLHVKDTERDTLKIKKIVRELSVLKPDLIIGPVYSEDVKITGRLAEYLETNLVSPLSTRHQLITNNSRIFQVIPSRQAEGEVLARYMKNFTKGQFVLIRGTDSASMSNSWRFKKYMLESLPQDSLGNPLHFEDHKLNDSLIAVLGKVLSRDVNNIIIVFSDNEPDVSKLISRLSLMSAQHPMQLFGMPSWQTLKNVDWNYFHSLQVNLITPFYTDYTDPAIKHFLAKSRDAFGYEPYEISPLGYNFSMLGYDIGLYFLNALKQYGKNFSQCIDQIGTDQLLTRYRFIREGEGGYVNNNFVLIRYKNDYTVEKIAILEAGPVF